jgi:hypothetical protein
MKTRNRIIGQVAGEKPHKISDKSARLWESYHGPMNGAAQALNAAIVNVQNILAGIILDAEGFDKDTHLFNADNLTIVRKPNAPQPPPAAGDNGG